MERLTKFFTSLGGVLTSLAAIVGGVVALYVAFGGGGDKSSEHFAAARGGRHDVERSPRGLAE